MTRPKHPTQAAGARTKHRSGAGAVSPPASMKFLAFEENGGAFHWAIVAASRDRLVQSPSSASCEEATLAAGIVRCGAGSVPVEDRADDITALELAGRRETATVRDDLDAERWLDEGGSFNSEAVTRGAIATMITPVERLAPSSSPDPRRTYGCPECGHVLRVSGLGRHRAHFELTDDRADEPVTNRVCPLCGHSRPGKNPA